MLQTVADLLDALRRYRLVEAPRADEIERDLGGRFARPLDLARELLQRGWLTAYQVNQLFQDRGPRARPAAGSRADAPTTFP